MAKPFSPRLFYFIAIPVGKGAIAFPKFHYSDTFGALRDRTPQSHTISDRLIYEMLPITHPNLHERFS
ncbi:hypothetical protein ACSQ6I_15760 [Anabaena sp. WFMT]|uniref:hypothetical protein n=1 Tax=Anabaena sp. WFMT TaxID=3449730 RepID=UPI003F267829